MNTTHSFSIVRQCPSTVHTYITSLTTNWQDLSWNNLEKKIDTYLSYDIRSQYFLMSVLKTSKMYPLTWYLIEYGFLSHILSNGSHMSHRKHHLIRICVCEISKIRFIHVFNRIWDEILYIIILKIIMIFDKYVIGTPTTCCICPIDHVWWPVIRI